MDFKENLAVSNKLFYENFKTQEIYSIF